MVRASAVKGKCDKAHALMQAEVNLVWRSHTHEAQAHCQAARGPFCRCGVAKSQAKADTLWVVKKKRQGSASCRDCTEMKGCSALSLPYMLQVRRDC